MYIFLEYSYRLFKHYPLKIKFLSFASHLKKNPYGYINKTYEGKKQSALIISHWEQQWTKYNLKKLDSDVGDLCEENQDINTKS